MDKKPVYIDVVNPGEEDISSLKSIFHFHPVNLEDCTFFSESPKIEEHRDYIFTVIHSVIFNEKENLYENHDVHIFLGNNYIISVHDIDLEVVHEALARIVNEPETDGLSCDYAYYTILDSIVDSYFPILSFWSDEIDKAEEHVFDRGSENDAINNVIHIRKGLIAAKRIIMPQREIIYRISHTNMNFIDEDVRAYLRDVFDHIEKLYTTIEEHRDLLSNLMDAHFSKASEGLNEVMKRLTVISTIFMPLTFIVGIYGMNFRNMPELGWRYGYFIILLLMVLVGVASVWYFKRKKWF